MHRFYAARSASRLPHRCFTRSCASPLNNLPASSVLAYADGASRGNPGRSGCGALLMDPSTGRVLASDTKYVGNKETNNEAEYHGLMLALRLAQRHQATYVQCTCTWTRSSLYGRCRAFTELRPPTCEDFTSSARNSVQRFPT
ncbi:unnamed protein product [Peronospora destructor]|uniref:RNase H type-1 domain-containing protein n=1 Tax=Peronospora destructor TaxID=86335 RepID=A0AAV0T6M5_9STRA|nr:unnamed protein product [Peronospora destructor]